jgi:hypothetical protein
MGRTVNMLTNAGGRARRHEPVGRSAAFLNGNGTIPAMREWRINR